MAKKDKVTIDGLSKKERKALEHRAAEIEAELAKKAKKRAAKLAPQLAAADAILAVPTDHPDAVALPESAGTPDSDAEIKARLATKRAEREAAKIALDNLDRSDADAVAAFNATHGLVIGHLATSEAEKAAADARMADVIEARAASADPVERIVENAAAVIATSDDAEEVERATEAKAHAEAVLDTREQVAEEVETDHGREFAVGTAEPEPVADDFATVGDAERKPEVELNGNGQYKILQPDGKVRGYTRVTTFIDCLEDKSALDKWKARALLEGIVANEDEVARRDDGLGDVTMADLFTSRVRDLIHNRDVELARIAKRDRKGKLAIGERGRLEADVWSTFKRALNEVAEQALELGGVHEKANKGTNLHALADVYDTKGSDEVDAMLHDGLITPADHADIMAYGAAMARAGIKVVGVEKYVVDDERKLAGRLDRIVLAKLPGAQRAVRMVADLKTGQVEYGLGKIAMQLETYATCKGYNPEHPEAREELRLSRTKGLLIHLPQGEATCRIIPADLTVGKAGTKLATEVRQWRNAGKRAIDLKLDLAAGGAE